MSTNSAMIGISCEAQAMSGCSIAVVLAAALLPWSLPARAEGDIAAGRDLAVEWCSRCHDIWPGAGTTDDPPSFAAIAMSRTQQEIRGNILAPHAMMPEVARILGLNVDDLVAYITSLSRPPQ
jgi:mono/diheme cytochrome c family protein